LRKILLFSHRLEEEMGEALPERGRTYLKKIQKAAERMLNMIKDVLTYSSMDLAEHRAEKVDLQAMVGEIKTDLDMVFQEKKADLAYRDLPEIEGAPVLLYQLFYNLIYNALKFSRPEVAARIQISSERMQLQGKEYVRIKVSDNGIGFKQEHAERIFESFSRLHSKDKYEGTGLGLALCKKIVERHHGTILGFGELGSGAVFEMTLPAKQ
jgi:signal transduction histidine kinase